MVNINFTMWHIWCHSSNIHPKFIQHPCTILQYYSQIFPPNKMEIKSNPMKDQGVDINFTMWHKQCQSSNIHPKSLDNLATLQYCEFVFSTNLEIKKNPIKDQV